MPFTIRVKRNTVNPTTQLLEGELGYNTSTDKLFIGNGTGVSAKGVSMDGHTHTTSDITNLKDSLLNLFVYGKASATITKGQAIQFAGVEGDHILIKPAVPSEINANPEYFIGVAETNLATNGFGYVVTNGQLTGINTSSYTAGQILWFASGGGTAGAYSTTEPTGTNARIRVFAVNRVNAGDGIITVRVDFMGRTVNDIKASGTLSSSTFLRGDGSWNQVAFTNITGTATTTQIPNLDTSKLTSGTLPIGRGGTGNTSVNQGGVVFGQTGGGGYTSTSTPSSLNQYLGVTGGANNQPLWTTPNDSSAYSVLSSSGTTLSTERDIYFGTHFNQIGISSAIASSTTYTTMTFTSGMRNFILQVHQDTTTGSIIARLPLTITGSDHYSLDTTARTHRIAWSNGTVTQVTNVDLFYTGTTLSFRHNFTGTSLAFRWFGY
jgi:hypothetical protein